MAASALPIDEYRERSRGCEGPKPPARRLAIGIAAEQTLWDSGYTQVVNLFEQANPAITFLRYVYTGADNQVFNTMKTFLKATQGYKRLYIPGSYSSQMEAAQIASNQLTQDKLLMFTPSATASLLPTILSERCACTMLPDIYGTAWIMSLYRAYQMQRLYVVYNLSETNVYGVFFDSFRIDLMRQAAAIDLPITFIDISSVPNPIPDGTLVLMTLSNEETNTFKDRFVPVTPNTSVLMFTDPNEKLPAAYVPEGFVALSLVHQPSLTPATVALNQYCATNGLPIQNLYHYTYYLHDLLKSMCWGIQQASITTAQGVMMHEGAPWTDNDFAAVNTNYYVLERRTVMRGSYAFKFATEPLLTTPLQRSQYLELYRAGTAVTDDSVTSLWVCDIQGGAAGSFTSDLNVCYAWPAEGYAFGPEWWQRAAGGERGPLLFKSVPLSLALKATGVISSVTLLEGVTYTVSATMGKTIVNAL
jgi:hypothetical protein